MAKGLGRGGIEQFLTKAVRHVDRERFAVEVAYLLPHKDQLVPELEAQGVKVHCLASSRPTDIRWLARLRSVVGEGKFDIVHSHMPYPAVGARLALNRRGLVVVHTEHNVWPRYRRPTFWANALSYRRNDTVIAVSDAVLRSIQLPRVLSRPLLPPIEVVAHGIEPGTVQRGPDARARARAFLGLREDELVLGTVGSLTLKKDPTNLLTAMAMLLPDRPSLRLVMVGAGPLEPALRREIERRRLGANVRLLGSRDDVPELLPAFDVFVLSSRYEGLPLALVEAMAAELPSVATSVGGVPELVEDGLSGLLVAPRDPAALAAAVEKLLSDPQARAEMGWWAGVAASRWNVAAAVEHTQEIYERVLRRRRRH